MAFLRRIEVRQLLAALLILSMLTVVTYVTYLLSESCRLNEDASLPAEAVISVSQLRSLSHVAIFLLVGFLVGPWQGGSTRLAWMYILIGGLSIEIIQSLGFCERDWLEWLDGLLDLGMDALGGWIGIWLARRYGQKGA